MGAQVTLTNQEGLALLGFDLDVVHPVTLGLYTTTNCYEDALRFNCCHFDRYYAGKILRLINLAQVETRVNLVIAEVVSNFSPKLGELVDSAKEFGLRPCDEEAGPAFRLARLNQPNGESLRIVMKPIECEYQRAKLLWGFTVDNVDGKLWLGLNSVNPESRMRQGELLVFTKPS